MKNKHKLQFHCQNCEEAIVFSVLDIDTPHEVITCKNCNRRYLFDDNLMKQLKQFEALCKQIHASKKILGSTSVAINVGSHSVKVPFNILLTRLSSVIELDINGQKSCIAFRVEPLEEVPAFVSSGD